MTKDEVASEVAADAPVVEVAADAPVVEVAADAPVVEVAADAPVVEVAADAPVVEVAADAPVVEVAADAPVVEVAADAPVVKVAADALVVEVAAGVAVSVEVCPAPQALISAKTKIHANRVAVAVFLCAIVTCFHSCVIHAECKCYRQDSSHGASLSLTSVTPLSATYRPEALRPRLATGLPFNDWQ